MSPTQNSLGPPEDLVDHLGSSRQRSHAKTLSVFELALVGIAVMSVVGLTLVWNQYMLWRVSGLSADADQLERAGVAGDAFGALNALFSGLALIGLFVAIRLQTKELEEQRKQLQDQQAELQKQHDVMVEAIRYNAIAAKIQALVPILSSNNSLAHMHETRIAELKSRHQPGVTAMYLREFERESAVIAGQCEKLRAETAGMQEEISRLIAELQQAIETESTQSPSSSPQS